MADGIVEGPERKDYPGGMEARVAVLETLAAQVAATLTEMRREAQDFRVEMRAELRGVRAEMSTFRSELGTEIRDLRSELDTKIHGLRSELRTEVHDLRRVHDRDFRITFGGIITATVGLAALIARLAHWI